LLKSEADILTLAEVQKILVEAGRAFRVGTQGVESPVEDLAFRGVGKASVGEPAKEAPLNDIKVKKRF
jgi:hypothetical protein